MIELHIDENEVKELTRQLIRIKSVNPPGEVDECAQFILDWFLSNGIEAVLVQSSGVSNIVARYGKKGGRRLLWNGHFDVVPAGLNWTVDPFEAVEKDGYIFGRGASDMKSGVAAMMVALKVLKENAVDLDGEIEFWGIGDEETGSVNGTRMLLKEHSAEFDGAVSSEPTDFYIENAQRGLRWIQIKISGSACHAGRPHVGKNAVEHSAKVIDALKNIRFEVSNNIFEEHLRQPSLSVTIISGGRQTNIIPEECTLTIDRRMLPGETEASVTAEIQAALDSIITEGFAAELSLVNKGWDPFITEPDDPVVSTIAKAFQAVTGSVPRFRGKGGCTDASHIFHAGIPVVIIGPGSANESHTADEKVEVARLGQSAEIFAQAAIDFLNNINQRRRI